MKTSILATINHPLIHPYIYPSYHLCMHPVSIFAPIQVKAQFTVVNCHKKLVIEPGLSGRSVSVLNY